MVFNMNPFEFVNSININKNHMMDADPLVERQYNAFMVNRSLSYFPDTIFMANQMNINHHIDGRMQYDYLFYSVPAKRRYSKWHKPEIDVTIQAIRAIYGYNVKNARQALQLLKPEQISQILEEYRHREGK